MVPAVLLTIVKHPRSRSLKVGSSIIEIIFLHSRDCPNWSMLRLRQIGIASIFWQIKGDVRLKLRRLMKRVVDICEISWYQCSGRFAVCSGFLLLSPIGNGVSWYLPFSVFYTGHLPNRILSGLFICTGGWAYGSCCGGELLSQTMVWNHRPCGVQV